MATNTEQPFVSISGCNKIIYIPSNVRVRYYSSLNDVPVDELHIPDYYIITSDGTPNGDVFGVYNYNGEVFVELKENVLYFREKGDFPLEGVTGVIYVDGAENILYVWSDQLADFIMVNSPETDPTVPIWVKQITQADINRWNAPPVVPEYTIDLINNQLKIYKDGVEVGSEDLSPYVNNEELFIQSGSLNSTTGVITFYRNDGTSFNVDASALFSNEWKKSGNSGTTPGTDFIGTTDTKDLVFKTKNTERMRIGASDGKFAFNLGLAPTVDYRLGTFKTTDIAFQIENGVGNKVVEFNNDGHIGLLGGGLSNVALNANGGSFPILFRITNGTIGEVFRIENSGKVMVMGGNGVSATEALDINGNIRLRSPLNATNDITFTKKVVAKSDGTLGIVDFNENIPFVSLPLLNSSKFTANSYVKYRVKDNTFCIHGHLTFNAGQNYTVGETICDLPYTLIPVFSVPNNSFMIPFDGGIINDIGAVNKLIIEYRPAFSIYRLMFNQAISQSGFNMGTSFYYEIKL